MKIRSPSAGLSALCLSSLFALSSCTSTVPADAPLFILLGEVHDNPAHHAARAASLRELLADEDHAVAEAGMQAIENK